MTNEHAMELPDCAICDEPIEGDIYDKLPGKMCYACAKGYELSLYRLSVPLRVWDAYMDKERAHEPTT